MAATPRPPCLTAPGHEEICVHVHLAGGETVPLRNNPEHGAHVQHMVVEGKVTHRQQINAGLALQVPVAGSELPGSVLQVLDSGFVLPEGFQRLFEFPVLSHAGKSQIVRQHQPLLFALEIELCRQETHAGKTKQPILAQRMGLAQWKTARHAESDGETFAPARVARLACGVSSRRLLAYGWRLPELRGDLPRQCCPVDAPSLPEHSSASATDSHRLPFLKGPTGVSMRGANDLSTQGGTARSREWSMIMLSCNGETVSYNRHNSLTSTSFSFAERTCRRRYPGGMPGMVSHTRTRMPFPAKWA